MDCTTALEGVQDDLDGRLAAADADALRAHLSTCAACAAEARGFADLRRALRAETAVVAPATLRQDVIARLPRGRLVPMPLWLGGIAAAAAVVVAFMIAPGDESSHERQMDGGAAGLMAQAPKSALRNVEEKRADRDDELADDPVSRAQRILDAVIRERSLRDEAERESGAAMAASDETSVDAPSPDAAGAPPPPATVESAADSEKKVPATAAAEPAQDSKREAGEGALKGRSAEEDRAKWKDAAAPTVRYVVFATEADARRFVALTEGDGDERGAPATGGGVGGGVGGDLGGGGGLKDGESGGYSGTRARGASDSATASAAGDPMAEFARVQVATSTASERTALLRNVDLAHGRFADAEGLAALRAELGPAASGADTWMGGKRAGNNAENGAENGAEKKDKSASSPPPAAAPGAGSVPSAPGKATAPSRPATPERRDDSAAPKEGQERAPASASETLVVVVLRPAPPK